MYTGDSPKKCYGTSQWKIQRQGLVAEFEEVCEEKVLWKKSLEAIAQNAYIYIIKPE